MKNAIILWVLFLMGCAASSVQRVSDFSTSDVEKIVGAVVALRQFDHNRAHCAGVYVGDYVVTAAHCMDTNLVVATERDLIREIWSPYECWHYDEAQDIAVLSPMSSELRRHGSLVLAPYEPWRGQRVGVVGHPAALWFSWSSGDISFPRRKDEDGTIWIQTTAPIYFGNSGGAMVDENGQLLGIASAMARGVTTLGLFVHVDAIRKSLSAPMSCPDFTEEDL